ncbi:MAG: hypothetical protein Q8839_02200 [Candidatus Phytoplasma australasiaticum]|nr:hypothetical protein [Candidatus Phytoplasma australasiaticum]MDV3153735.1 hypothetical protein [Candidatus Phytoplasma australasiaticum]MDV3167579.1 hypothetical protein [Candidatus Phytoplasma australasiaticum]MDV3180973.1 hypothetical protein [Candidatus Phytoplasma australasiaticum]MDV3183139.1 hypothetical protein [Candidatus Phytoplasma australasiaticum]
MLKLTKIKFICLLLLALLLIYLFDHFYYTKKDYDIVTTLNNHLDFRISENIPINEGDRIIKIIKIIDQQGNIKEYDPITGELVHKKFNSKDMITGYDYNHVSDDIINLDHLDNFKKKIFLDGNIHEYDDQKRLFRKINSNGIIKKYDHNDKKIEIILPNKDYKYDKYLLQEKFPEKKQKTYKYHKIQETFANGITRYYKKDVIQEISNKYIREYNPKTKTIQKIIFPNGEQRKYYGFYLFFLDQDNLIDKFIRKYRIHKMHKNYFFKLEQEILPDGTIIKYDNNLLPIQIKTKDNIIKTEYLLNTNTENNSIKMKQLPDNSIVEIDETKNYKIIKITDNNGITKNTEIIYSDNDMCKNFVKIIFPHGYIQEFDEFNGNLVKEIWPNQHIFEYTYLGNTMQLKKEITSTGNEIHYYYDDHYPLTLSNIVIPGIMYIPCHLPYSYDN